MYKGNVLLIVDSMGIGGAEKVSLTLAQGFINEGYKVDLMICDNIIKFEIPKNITLHILDFKKSYFDYYRYSKKLTNMIKDIEYKNKRVFDLILVNLQKSTRLMKNNKHNNIYHIVHSTFSQSALKKNKFINNFFKRKKLQKIYNNLNIITVSNGIQEDLLNNINIKPKSIQTIYNPIDINKTKELSLEKINFNEQDYIVHVGRFAKVKRHDILIKAFAQANLNTKLVLVGDGEEKENIIHLVEKLNISDKVILIGFVANPFPYIKNAKLLVLSSDYEGFGMVLIEALALNTLIMSTNCKSGPSEIMTDCLNKYLVPVNDINKLASMMQFIYENPYTISNQLVENFALENIIKKYTKLKR